MKDLQCVHKDVFPLEILEFFGSMILGIMVALSNAGGIGGGGIIVPIAIVFFRFRTKQAVALSNFCIFTASVVRFIINFNQKHPKKDSKVIDYGIIMVMFPMVLLGSLLGVQVNLLMPEIILLGALTLILIFLAIKSYFASKKIYRKENEERKKEAQVDSKSEEEHELSNRIDNIRDPEEGKNSHFEDEENEGGEDEKPVNQESENNDTNHGTLPPIFTKRQSKSSSDSEEDVKTSREMNKEKENVDQNSSQRNTAKDENNGIQENDGEELNEGDIHPKLAKILKKEQSHWKPSTYFLFPFLFVVLILLVLIRGTSSVDSIVGIES